MAKIGTRRNNKLLVYKGIKTLVIRTHKAKKVNKQS